MEERWSLERQDYAGVRARRKAFRALLAQYRTAHLGMHELVFGELVTNAVKYGDEPMSVAVLVRDGVVQIEVESTGECFDLHRRLEEEPTPTGGRGLRIVHSLVEKLTVEYADGRTCRVKATLAL